MRVWNADADFASSIWTPDPPRHGINGGGPVGKKARWPLDSSGAGIAVANTVQYWEKKGALQRLHDATPLVACDTAPCLETIGYPVHVPGLSLPLRVDDMSTLRF